MDSAPRSKARLAGGKLLCVALHGDYRYDHLKNLPDQLKSEDETMRAALLHRAWDYPLVEVGYSGRDESIMRADRRVFRGVERPPPLVRLRAGAQSSPPRAPRGGQPPRHRGVPPPAR